VKNGFKIVLFWFSLFSFSQENNTSIYITPEAAITGIDHLTIPKNKPNTVYVAPKAFFYHPNDVVVTYANNATSQAQNPVFSCLYVASNTVFYTPDDFGLKIVYLNNAVFEAQGIAQTNNKKQTTQSQATPKVSKIPSQGQSSQDKFQTVASVGPTNISSTTISKKTEAILVTASNYLQILSAKKQNFGYYADIKNFLLDILFCNRPPPALGC